MRRLHQTAYRALDPEVSQADLDRLFTVSRKERTFIESIAKRAAPRLVLAVYYKVFQSVGYFEPFRRVPDAIKQHVAQGMGMHRLPGADQLRAYEAGKHRRAHLDAIRAGLGVRTLDMRRDRGWLEQAANEAAETKHNTPDIINQLLDELVRRKFELPAYSTLDTLASAARSAVQDRYLGGIAASLSAAGKATIDDLLKRSGSELTGWNSLKREPRKATNREARMWLQHIERLRSLVDQMPSFSIPVSKLEFFRAWARSLDATRLSRLNATHRYGLAAIHIRAQLGHALDDVIELYLQLMQNLENTAVRRLQEHRLAIGDEVDALILQLRDTVVAAQTQGAEPERLKAIDASFMAALPELEARCNQHLAIRNRDIVPFLLRPFETARNVLLNCLSIAGLQAVESSKDSLKLVDALDALRRLRGRKDVELADLGLKPGDVSWMNEMWRRHVYPDCQEHTSQVDRVALELALHFRIRAEIRSGQLFVPQSERFDDIRERLVGDDRFPEQLADYGKTTCIETDPSRHVEGLKRTLAEIIRRVDDGFPDNAFATITSGKLSLKRVKRLDPAAEVAHLDALIRERMEQVTIVDVLSDAASWVDLQDEFRHSSGAAGRLKDLRSRLAATLLCYGCNIGPVQTARSLRTLSRKQASWINLNYVSEATLDKANTRVVNAFNQFTLPKLWGSGRSASADGTQWKLYEKNLISELHIRYGGYGGIGYNHVSDRYVALMSHFTTCGTYEAIHILDGLLNNQSQIQPDTVHGDTQAQSLPVFALAHLLGIKLMPRIRNMRDLIFSRADKRSRCKHIEPLFGNTIDWALIEKHLPEMMRVAVSIKMGLITSSAILRRLGTYSEKNAMYFAFRELGKVIRTCFMLEYIDDVEVRKTIQAATNKSEQYNNFVKLIFFGGEGIIGENVRHEQQKMVKYGQLAANLVILHNTNQMSTILRDLKSEGLEISDAAIRGLSPYRLGHIDRLGSYLLDERRKPPDLVTDWSARAGGQATAAA